MAWIEVHQSLPTHRKTLALADALELPPAHVTGHLVCLWLWALDNAQDGCLNVSPRMLARAAQWDGDPQSFVAALTATGFLDATGGIHDWDAYAGRLIAQRERNAEKQRNWREQQRLKAAGGDVTATAPPYIEIRDGDVAVTSPSRTAATNQPTVPTESLPDGRGPAADAPADPAPFAALPEDAEPPVRAVPKPKRDRASGHAAVRLYRRATEINPKEGVRQQIEEAIDAEDEEALGRWQHVLQEWLSRGYSAKNVAGLLDWFADGIPQRKRPAGASSPAMPERTYVPNPGPPPVEWDEAKAAASDAERERTRQELVAGGVLSGRRAPPGVNGAAKPPPPDPAAAEERLREKERRLLAEGVLTAEQVQTARRARQPAHAIAGA